MILRFANTAACLAVLSAVTIAAGPAAAIQHSICVRNYVKVPLTDSEADDIISRANAILATVGQANPNCAKASLVRSGAVVPYDTEMPGSLGSSSDFNKLNAQPCVKVVQRITWCDGLNLSGGFLGCTQVVSRSVVLVRTFPGLAPDVNKGTEPVTWLHELGHTLGLVHNEVDANDVMSPGISPTTVQIAKNECATYAGLPTVTAATKNLSGKKAAAIPKLIMPADGAPTATAQSPVPLEEFVKRPFGKAQIPAAEGYKGDVRKAEQMLFDPAFENYRNNIAGLLAIIGTPDSVPVLEKFIRTPIIGTTSSADVLARFAALTSIGAIANRYKLSDDKVAILREAQNPTFWAPLVQPENAEHKIDDSDAATLSRDLSFQSTQAYGITGSKKAADFLKSAKKDLSNAAVPEEVRQNRNDALDQAIRLNAVSKVGKSVSDIFRW